MASLSSSSPPSPVLRRHNRTLLRLSSPVLPFPSLPAPLLSRCLALRAAGAEGGRVKNHAAADDPALLRRPSSSSPDDDLDAPSNPGEKKPPGQAQGRRGRQKDEEDWVDWEDTILEDTVPLVGFVRMILHSGKYESGDRLSIEHEKIILERLLPYHPECENKIGCGIDYITIGFHPQYENSRCLFIVRTDGKLVDFSYWKCIKGFIRKNYPLYADTFILRHFRRRRYDS
ncbi:hypothetical protein Cni_G04903 [Canna indica]|uniref:DCL protein n=1 Tax=Canna indica TaxID=4628 RepID=A0AAQ3JUB1_9LILI|nr:hypothetical protein Cni_G04903 [Canna indica]